LVAGLHAYNRRAIFSGNPERVRGKLSCVWRTPEANYARNWRDLAFVAELAAAFALAAREQFSGAVVALSASPLSGFC
jgi:hypothetical protein